MNHVELFAGVGGFRRAMDLITHDLGFPIETVAYSEIDNKFNQKRTNLDEWLDFLFG